MVDQRDPRVHADPLRQVPAGDRPRRLQGSLGSVDHRPDPQRLGDHRVEVCVAVVRRARRAARSSTPGLWSSRSTPKRAPSRSFRGPRRASSSARRGARRRSSAARPRPGRAAAARARRFALRGPAPAAAARSPRRGARRPPRSRLASQPPGLHAPAVAAQRLGTKKSDLGVDHGQHRSPQPLDAVRLIDAEDRSADDLEGERPHPLAHREPLSPGPAIDLGLRDPADQRPHRLGRRALKRRQQQPPLAQVLRRRRGRARSARRARPTAARSPHRRGGRTDRR